MTEPISFLHQLPDRYSSQVAALYFESFKNQLLPIFRTDYLAHSILSRSFNSDRVIVAISDQGLAGFVGFHKEGRQFVGLSINIFVEEYGLISGLLKFFLCMVFSHESPKRHLLLDGLVVHPLMRKKGIGTQLLNEIADYARKEGFIAIQLEVEDDNHEAKRLYQRLGFEAIKKHRIPILLRSVFGFSSYTTMIKEIISFRHID